MRYGAHYINTSGSNAWRVYFGENQDGGGCTFGQEYATVLADRYPGQHWPECFEWCSGPGFIAYNILDHGLVDRVTLADIYQPSLDMAQKTANDAGISVQILPGDGIGHLPSDLKFDLVVGNPPHYDFDLGGTGTRINHDPEWSVHRDFFSRIGQHLTPNGMILLQENRRGSKPQTFQSMIEQNGLRIADSYASPAWIQNGIYYLEIRLS